MGTEDLHPSRSSRASIAALGIFLVMWSFAYLWTASDYGLTWDSALGELALGERVVSFWGTGDLATLDLDRRLSPRPGDLDLDGHADWLRAHPEHVWALGPALAALSGRFLFGVFDPVTARHLSLLPLVLCLAFGVFHFARRAYGECAAIASVVALLLAPRFFADAHNNVKDIPATVLWCLTTICFFEVVATGRRSFIFLAGLLFGLALAAKANAVFLPVVLVLWACALRWRSGAIPWNPLRLFVSSAAALPFSALAYGAASPHLLVDFPRRFFAHLDYLRAFGSLGPPAFQLLPSAQLLAVTPSLALVFALLGAVTLGKMGRPDVEELRPGLLVLLWLVVPVARVSLPYANDFDGIRHFQECVPALCVLTGVGFAWLVRKRSLGTRLALGAVVAIPTIVWSIRYHPFEIAFYNSLVGGLPGARQMAFPQATDYWGSSYRRAIRWLNENAEQNSELFVGVGSHIVALVAPIELRPDIRLRPLSTLDEPLNGAARYLLFVTRTERYPEVVRVLDARYPMTMSFDVEGEPILKLLRLSDPVPQ